MEMQILNGKELANIIKDDLKKVVNDMNANGQRVHLAVIQVGNDSASSVYVNNKQKACEYIGIDSGVIKLPEDVSQIEVLRIIDELNHDNSVNGIMVQLPLPRHLDAETIISAIFPAKDVDGFTKMNAGAAFLGYKSLISCTPLGIMKILQHYNIDIVGKECVVVGRSNIVGKPMAMLFLQNDGTVTVCQSKTKNLKEVCKRADILVCAIGKPKFFNRDYIKDGAVVIDVGIHRQDNGRLCGDVDFDDVKDIVSAITPVPGGVGPLTVSMLMHNCVQAAQNQHTQLHKEGE
jgi:methylenetetrahydrofolate dehydrogenase (NADP+)/methenyltetrahydrofolate cyclohydrolase